jgi:hypothetical protein
MATQYVIPNAKGGTCMQQYIRGVTCCTPLSTDSDTHIFALYQDTACNLLLADGVVLRQGSYLSAVADIGVFEHSLTTDLLNHLVFVQKVFMKVSCWYDDDDDGGGGGGDATFHILYFAVYIIFV